MAEIAVSDAVVAHNVPLLPRVQGIRSSIDDITLRGDRLIDRVGEGLMDGTLTRKMSGASELRLEILDKGAKLLNSQLLEDGYNLRLDGLGFTYVGYERPSIQEALSLTHEAQVVNRLRQLHGPHKAFRDEMTRAQFLRARVMELKPPRPRFVCPELNKIQPIKSSRDGRKAAEDAKQNRGKGIGEVELTVKGEKAGSSQIAAGDRALRVAEGEGADTRVMLALMLALIVESEIGKLTSNWLEIEPQSVSGFKGDPNSLEQAVRGFLLGYNSQVEGAIEYFKKHPDAKAYEITQAVQRSGAGAASGGAGNYGPWADEAAEWVSAYGGGAEITETLRYPFEEKEDENHWKCGARLAGQVNWRWFESAGWVYLIAEPTLFKSHTRLLISDSTPGVLDTSIKGDEGKSHEEVTVEAMAKMWSAPPGSCVQLRRHGPANGAYLVDRIESPLAKRESVCQITLKRPSKPRKEPPPPTRTRSLSSGGSLAPEDAPPAIEKMIAEIDATDGTFHYVWGGGHGSAAELAQRLKGYDCSGYISHILWAGGLLDSPETSGTLAGMYEAGEGDFLTIYANSKHVFAKILTSDGWRYFQSGGGDNSTGWVPTGKQDSLAGYSARHPKGL
jgi:hypothetical protein